jgi:hypothetical protein
MLSSRSVTAQEPPQNDDKRRLEAQLKQLKDEEEAQVKEREREKTILLYSRSDP